MIGKIISHYKIIEKIDEGGMGSVYKAQDLKLGRLVALKFLKKDFGAGEEVYQRFINEARVVSALDHPNIAVVHEIDEFEDSIFISMGYYEGPTLKEMIASGPMPLNQVQKYALQIAQGLSQAHRTGIVHRDIKPGNIIITKDDQVKILDFGLAKATAFTEITRHDSILGTALYMSPEQTRGDKVDHRSDIFSFGIVLYEMLTGKKPFQGEYSASIAYSIVNENPTPPNKLRNDIPQAFSNLVMKALAKEKDARYQTAQEMESDLRVVTEPGAAITLSFKKAKKFAFTRAKLSILAALLGTVLLLLFFLRGNDQQRQNVAKSIAVMPFEYEGSEEDWKWLGNAVTELVNTKLAQHPTLRILDAQQRTSIMQNLGLSGSTPTLEQKLEIARKAKADNLLVGSLRKSGDRIRVEANVFETKHGTLRTALESVENNHSKLYDVANQLSDQLNNVLNIDAKTNHSAGTAAQPSLDAFRYFLEGRDAALDRRFQESIDKLTKAISLDPDYIDPYRWLAWVYRDMGDYINAKQILAKGKPHISQLSEEMRLEYLLTEAQIENRWKDYAAYLEQLLRIDPHDAVDHFRYGWTQYKKFRNLDAGIQAMEKSLELDSTYGWTYKMLGFAYLEKGDQQKALQRLEKYVALNPADVDPLDSKAEIHLYIGQYDQAIALCERILAIQPDYISTRIILTSTYIALGKYSRALDEIDRFMKLTTSPEFKSIGQSLQSEILFLQSKYNEALGSIGYAIALDSTNVEARWVRGRILLHLNDMPALNDELVAIDRALLKSGGLDGRWLLYHLQGEMALHEQKFDNAIEWFNKALDLAPPDRAFFLTALGEAYQQSGQLQLAIQNYNAALAVNPNHALAAFGLARTYEKSGKSSDAKRAYEKVVEIWSKADVQIEELEIARKKVKS